MKSELLSKGIIVYSQFSIVSWEQINRVIQSVTLKSRTYTVNINCMYLISFAPKIISKEIYQGKQSNLIFMIYFGIIQFRNKYNWF